MSGCRIARVRMKKGGATLHLPSLPSRGYCHAAVEAMGQRIVPDTLIAGYFIMHADRTVTTGWSHEAGITTSDLLGAVDVLKNNMANKIYHEGK